MRMPPVDEFVVSIDHGAREYRLVCAGSLGERGLERFTEALVCIEAAPPRLKVDLGAVYQSDDGVARYAVGSLTASHCRWMAAGRLMPAGPHSGCVSVERCCCGLPWPQSSVVRPSSCTVQPGLCATSQG
jgi:hypothetical protein